MRKEIKKAMACYTGGNQYIYYGQFEDGQYFFASDDSYCIELLKYEYDIEEHFTDDDTNGYIDDALLWLDILDWITLFAPNGNYSMYELEERIKECKQHIRYGCKQEIIYTIIRDLENNKRKDFSFSYNGNSVEIPVDSNETKKLVLDFLKASVNIIQDYFADNY